MAIDRTISTIGVDTAADNGKVPTFNSTTKVFDMTTPSGGGGIVVGSVASAAQPAIDTDAVNAFTITAQAEAITSMSTNLTGTPTNFKELKIRIKDNGTARTITWGSSFEEYEGVKLPTITQATKLHTMGFSYNSVTSKWGCLSSVPIVPALPLEGDVLIVGGGGGASMAAGGGGEYRFMTALAIPAGAYTVTVGAGGTAGFSQFANGNTGGSSVFGSTTSVGGSGGGGQGTNGSAATAGGNSGGGGRTGASTSGGTVVTGFAGGNGALDGSGGGGGSSAVGAGATVNAGGNGGAGNNNSITGSVVGYAGGGGGEGASSAGTATHGGGAGTVSLTGTAGTVNTGGGGGGGGNGGQAGGSGVVIVTYLTANFGACTGGTITTNGSFTVHRFTSSGTFTSVAL